MLPVNTVSRINFYPLFITFIHLRSRTYSLHKCAINLCACKKKLMHMQFVWVCARAYWVMQQCAGATQLASQQSAILAWAYEMSRHTMHNTKQLHMQPNQIETSSSQLKWWSDLWMKLINGKKKKTLCRKCTQFELTKVDSQHTTNNN